MALGSACASAAAPPSGLTGRVMIGPTCPVQRLGERCERPYRTEIVVLRARDQRRVTLFRSGSDGRFRVRLTPGRYVLEAASPGLPRLTPLQVTVRAGRFTAVTIVFDSGIR